MRSKFWSAPFILLGAVILVAACSPRFGGAPEREVIVVPQGTTVMPAR